MRKGGALVETQEREREERASQLSGCIQSSESLRVSSCTREPKRRRLNVPTAHASCRSTACRAPSCCRPTDPKCDAQAT